MILAFKLTFRELFRFMRDKNQRIFWWLAIKYGNKLRLKNYTAKFKGLQITLSDAESFVWQFKEIFADELYRFKTNKETPVIYDCGANIGMSVLYFSKGYPLARIEAFEAHPKVANILCANLDHNKIKNVQVHAKAVWTNNMGIEISGAGADDASIFGTGNKMQIQSIRLADFLAKEASVDMLKMDIEGAELEVLKDCEAHLHKVKNLFVEFHSFSSQKQQLSEVIEILQRQNFRYDIYNVNRLKTSPLLQLLQKDKTMDLQLNIFAKR